MRVGWDVNRKKPYFTIGIRRLKCVRCGKKASFQWQICADGNNYRPLCKQCDIGLNRLVLNWMGHPRADELMKKYEDKVNAEARLHR